MLIDECVLLIPCDLNPHHLCEYSSWVDVDVPCVYSPRILWFEMHWEFRSWMEVVLETSWNFSPISSYSWNNPFRNWTWNLFHIKVNLLRFLFIARVSRMANVWICYDFSKSICLNLEIVPNEFCS